MSQIFEDSYMEYHFASVKCGEPVAPVHARRDPPTGTLFNPGSNRTFTCRPGFTIIGSATVTCQNNGSWSELPICEENEGNFNIV